MIDLKTVEDLTPIDPLISKQKQDVAKMRTSLLACDSDPKYASSALRNIAVLQVYHQISRIIKYTEMCDRIEDAVYTKLETKLQDSTTSLEYLLVVQEKLQKLLVDSQKLLAPYLDMSEFIDQATAINEDTSEAQVTVNLDVVKREKLRTSAKQVLKELNVG